MIEAVVEKNLYDYYYEFISEGQRLSIMNFGDVFNYDTVRATRHPYKIHLAKYTIVKKDLAILENQIYNFADFSNIMENLKYPSVLIGKVNSFGNLKIFINMIFGILKFRYLLNNRFHFNLYRCC